MEGFTRENIKKYGGKEIGAFHEREDIMRKILRQIVATCEGWEAVFFSYIDGGLFREPLVCWALGVKNSFPGWSKTPRCKAPEVPRSEAYLDVRRNNEG
jgi:hypothetical protein